MKVLPTGRKSSLAIFMYSTAVSLSLTHFSSIFVLIMWIIYLTISGIILNQVGFGTFLLRYIPGLVRSVLTELGIDEDMYNPVCKSPICFPLIFLDMGLLLKNILQIFICILNYDSVG